MGHDISLINKAREQIGYVRFSAWDRNADVFYELFDAQEFNGTVSGYGKTTSLSLNRMEEAYTKYNKSRGKLFRYSDKGFRQYQQKEIMDFIKKGIEEANKEGNVTIYFG